MAVRAQYLSNATPRELRGRGRQDVLEGLQMLQGCDHHIGDLLRAYTHLKNGATVFSDHQSDLTCNASGSRKRSRDDSSPMTLSHPPNPNQPTPPLFRCPIPVALPAETAATDAAVPYSLQQLSHEHGRLYGSAGTSTSGRPAASSVASAMTQDFLSKLYHQSLEIDAFIHLQTERLLSGLEHARKRHCRGLLTVLEQEVAKQLKEKEAELECARRRNAELEDKVRQMAAESQIWFNVAKNNEAVVSSLRTTLEQVLLESAATPHASEGDGVPFPIDDAQSCCYEEEERKVAVGEEEAATAVRRENEELRCRKACKVCQENEVSVLLLPCRHLCLCRDCESKLDNCPICHSMKNASLRIFMS